MVNYVCYIIQKLHNSEGCYVSFWIMSHDGKIKLLVLVLNDDGQTIRPPGQNNFETNEKRTETLP